MMDGVASNSLIGLPTYVDTFMIYYISCMGLGFSAPQANGSPSFAIQGKALWEQCAMPPVLGANHFAFHDIAKSGTSPNLDCDKMFNELWWLNYCFCEGIDIGAVGIFSAGEAVNISCHSRCEMTDMGDPFCFGICVCLCIDMMFREVWWSKYCFCKGIGIGAVGNPILGGEAVNICCHSKGMIIDTGDTF